MAYKDKDKQRAFQRAYQAKRRAEHKKTVLEMFGGGCMECGYSNILALQIDHVVAIRRKSRDTRNSDSGANLWRKVAIGEVSEESVQLLCANCHAIKTYNELYPQI